MRSCVFSLIILLFLSCSRTAEQEQEIFHIDLNKNYPEFPLSLTDIADIRFIKIGGEEEGVFFDSLGSQIYFDEFNHIIIAGQFGGTPVLMFDWNGHFIRKIGNVGNGPGEYFFRQIFVEPNYRCIHIVSSDERKIMEYDYDGNYFPESEKVVGLRFDTNGLRLFGNSLFSFNPSSHIIYESASGQKEAIRSDKPLHKLDPGTFEEDSTFVGIRYASPLTVPLSWERHPEYRQSFGYLIEGLSGLFAASFRSDTTYLIGRDFQVRPFLVNTSHNSGDRFVLPTAETRRFVFCAAKCYGEFFYYAIDKTTKQVFSIHDNPENPLPGLLEGKCQFAAWSPSLHPMYLTASHYSIGSLKRICDYLPEELKTIVDQCNDESNPILMVIKFKE